MGDGHRIVRVVTLVRGCARWITGAGLGRIAEDWRAEVMGGERGVIRVDDHTDGAQPPDVLDSDLARHAPVHQGGYRPEPGQREEVQEHVCGR